jgi:hypothetical protein
MGNGYLLTGWGPFLKFGFNSREYIAPKILFFDGALRGHPFGTPIK